MLYQIKDGTVSAGGQTILSHIDFYIKEKEKIAVVGKNGAGKTTLLRLLAGELTPDRDDSRGSYGRSNDMVTGAATAGSDLDGTAKRTQRAKKKKPSGNPETGITMSRNITIDMLRQADKSNQDLTIEQILLESCPDKDTFSKERFDYEMEYDRLFTGFGFEKSDKTRLFRSFSGGEQTKISLIKLLLKKPDLLLLDEPTNHLDMRTKDVLKQAIRDFNGTVILVSHDREFLDGLVSKVYEFGGGQVREHLGGIYDFLESRKLDSLRELEQRATVSKTEKDGNISKDSASSAKSEDSKLSYGEQKEFARRLRKAEKVVADIESEIAGLEKRIAEVEEKLATPDGAADTSLYELHGQLKKQLDDVMWKWSEASEVLDKLQK